MERESRLRGDEECNRTSEEHLRGHSQHHRWPLSSDNCSPFSVCCYESNDSSFDGYKVTEMFDLQWRPKLKLKLMGL